MLRRNVVLDRREQPDRSGSRLWPEKAAPASAAHTVSDRTRTPTRNICSLRITRARSITSSRRALRAIAAATWDSMSSLGGMRAKKPGRERRRGHRDDATDSLASRGAEPRIVANRSRSCGIGLEQREQLDTRRQAGQKPVEGRRRRRRDRRCRRAPTRSAGMSSVRTLAGPRAAGRRDGARNASRAPSAESSLGWRKPIAAKVLSGLGIIAVAGEDEAAGLGCERRPPPRRAPHSVAAPSRKVDRAWRRRAGGRRSR